MPRDFKRVRAAEAARGPNSANPLSASWRRRKDARAWGWGLGLTWAKPTGFIEFARVKPPARPVKERVGD